MDALNLNTNHPLDNVDVDTLRSAIDESRSPLIITDNQLPDNPIIYSNQAFLDLTGYEMDEIIGKNCRFLQGKDKDQSEVGDLRQAVKHNKSLRTTLKNYRKDGTPFWNDLIISPVKNEKGITTHFIGMQLDITQIVQSTERLQTKTRALELSNAELEQFTYAVSHDLQEPLRMISSYLQLIMKRYGETFDTDVTTFMNFATEGAERLQELIYDLLSLSRVSTTDDAFKKISMQVPVERAIQNLKASIDETGAQIKVGQLPDACVDPVQITQLFQNLISNAIKYRKPDQTPIVEVSAKKNSHGYTYSVKDNGIGIDEKFHERVFGVFQRLHTRQEYQGTGVGLAICSKIIDRHNGKIWVKSELNQGSTFFFSIPERIES